MKKYHGAKIFDNKWYGYRADRFDPRDYNFDLAHVAIEALPTMIDLRENCPVPMDQGQLGSCTAHGIIGAARFLLVKKGGPRDHKLSRLQLYYDERVIEGSVHDDSGAEIRDGIKALASIGVAHETLWPYTVSKFARLPPKGVYADAAKFKGLRYERVDVTVTAIKAAVATGYPVVVGFSVFESFESNAVASTGIVPMPNIDTEQMIGGHCVYVVGYGQHPGTFTCRNSWGTSWGDGGDFYMPEAYLGSADFGGDYWRIPSVTGITIGTGKEKKTFEGAPAG